MEQPEKRRLNADINVVPYIDVMLVLLVIFMVTAPLLIQGVDVNLPQTNAEPLPIQEEPLLVSIDANGALYLNVGENKHKQMNLEAIQTTVKKIISANPSRQVLIWADAAISYGRVLVLMSDLQQAGITNVGLVTDPVQ